MASINTLKPTYISFNLSYKVYCLPFHFNLDKYLSNGTPEIYYGSKLHRILWKFWLFLNIIVRLALISTGIHFDIMHAYSLSAKVQFYFYIIVQLLSVLFLTCTFFFPGKHYHFISTFYIYQQKFRLIHKIDLAKEDRIPERLVKASLLMESVVTFAAAPAYFSLIYFKVHIFALFNFESVLVTFILSLIGSFGIMIDFLSLNLYALNVFAYCAAVLRSLKASRWHPGITRSEKSKLRTLYRAHYIFRNLVYKEAEFLIGLCIVFGCSLMICGIFGVIHCYSEFGSFMSLAIIGTIIITIIIMKEGLQLALNITELSKQFTQSYLQNDTRISKRERKYFKACQPLTFPSGYFGIVKKSTFPFCMSDIVLLRVIDLLLLFRGR